VKVRGRGEGERKGRGISPPRSFIKVGAYALAPVFFIVGSPPSPPSPRLDATVHHTEKIPSR